MKKYSCLALLYSTLLLLPGYTLAAKEPPKTPLPNTFLIDEYMSPYASSPCLMSIREGLSRTEEGFWQPSDDWLRRLTSSFVNNIVNDRLSLISHEKAGHGFRVRSLPELKVSRYFIFHSPFNW
ncbi:MAG: hypothetical protein AAF963_01615, partial [Bacteroidota bacterium]